jgi:hypothetical protein
VFGCVCDCGVGWEGCWVLGVLCPLEDEGAGTEGRLFAGTGVAGGMDPGVCAEAFSPQMKIAVVRNAKSAAAGGQWRGDRRRNIVLV